MLAAYLTLEMRRAELKRFVSTFRKHTHNRMTVKHTKSDSQHELSAPNSFYTIFVPVRGTATLHLLLLYLFVF